MSKWDSCAIVITSSVYVSAPFTYLRDAGQREAQYMDALRSLIMDGPIGKIIVCDNSGYSYPGFLYGLAELYNKELELLSFKGDVEAVARYGKGYGEGEIMDFVWQFSHLIKRVEGFFKVTGRLEVANIRSMLKRSDLLLNYFMPVSLFRPRWMVPKAARPCVDTRVYYVTRDFFAHHLRPAYKEVREKEIYFLEHAYYKAIVQSGVPVHCFNPPPEIVGMSGSNGWIFKERSPLRKLLLKVVAFLGYVKPI
jgi:hypothetical protein